MPTKVLYIVGHPRCGSTILGNLLGEIPGVFHAGELHYLWRPALPGPRQMCGCGVAVRACPVWRQIFAVAFDAPNEGPPASVDPAAPTAWGLPGVDAARMHHLQNQALSGFSTAARLARGWHREQAGAAAEYLDVMARIYRAIASVTGASVIVDSSKWPHDASLAGCTPATEVAFTHLVREPFGAVYSRLPRDRPDMPGSAGPPSFARVVLESLRWVRSNVLAEVVVRCSGRPWATIRYEDFASDVGATLLRIASLVGLEARRAPIPEGEVVLETNHTTGGNRNRWQRGRVAIKADRSWREGLRPRDVATISWATWPYRLRYGYTS